MIAAVFFYWGKNYIDKVFWLLYLFLGLTIFGLLEFISSGSTFLISSFVRRILFTPAMIDNLYYDVFSSSPTYWSHNFLGRIFYNYPLDRAPNMYVGEVIMNQPGVSANVGLVTEGYFSFYYPGVLLHSIFIGLIFIILKQIKLNPAFFGLVFVYIYYINTSFLTVLLITHGLLFFLIYSYFFLNKNYEE